MEYSSGKVVNSMITTTAGAFTKKETDLVKHINPRPQQTEVASTEASQGMASMILGAIGYQQTRREETAGEGSDTSEAIDGETSSNQEVINETAEAMNNDDIPLPPLPPVDDVPPPPPLPQVDIPLPPLPPVDDFPPPPPLPPVDITLPPPSPVDDVDFPPPPPLPQVDIPLPPLPPQVDDFPPPPPLPQVDIPLPPLPPQVDDFPPPPPLPQVDDFPPPPPLPPVDIPLPPLPPQVDNVPPPPPLPPVEDAFVTEYENIIQETNPDTKKSRLEQFFTPNDDSDLTLRQVGWIFDLLDKFKNDSTQNNSAQNTITIALEAFLKNPSNDKDVFVFQYNLASKAIEKKILNTDDKTLQNLFSPSEDDITRETQYSVLKNELDSLKLFAGVLDINKNSLKVALDVFLQTPSENNNTFKAQCDLAKTAFENQIIDADDTILKNLFSPSKDDWIRYSQQFFISDLLNNKINADSDDSQIAFAKAALLNFLAKDASKNYDLLKNQYDFTQTAVEKGILKAEDKEIITKLLKKPSGDKDAFKFQCDLAKTAVEKGILKAKETTDKEIITKFLQTPSEYHKTFETQCDLAEEIFKTQTIDAEDAILKNLFSPRDNEYIRNNQYDVINNMLYDLQKPITDTQKNFLKCSLKAFLQTPSKDDNTFKAQCYLAQTAVEKNILKAEETTDKEIITKLLKKPPTYDNNIFKAQCNLAKAIKADDEIFENLFSPSDNEYIRKNQYNIINNMLDDLQEPITDTQKNFLKCSLKAFLKTPSKYHKTFETQCYLAQTAVTKGILKAEDKEIITKFLQTPSDCPGTFKAQYDLAEIAFKNEILNEDDKILQNLFSPSDDEYIRKHQYNVINNMLYDLQEPITDTQKNFLKCSLKAFLKTPSNDENVLKQQYDLAKAAIKNGIIEPEECEKISDKIKNLILGQKITVAKNLSYLTNNQLKNINEAKLLQDTKNENKQFKLEYFLDLKISRGLYNDNWEDLANVIKNNAKILTPEDDSNILTPKDNRNIYNDGVYNLAVIALKQMPLDKRNEILSFICQETNNSHLKELLTNDNKCNNEMLLTIRPVLKQYENQDVSRNFSNLSHDYRIPRTTDKCEVFEENRQRYLGYQGTNQRIKTDLEQKQIEYLFGKQRPNGNQQEVRNCWLVSKLKEFNYDPELKLFIMSRFSMDKNGDVSITLKNGNKVTFPKDIVEKATITVNDEHLSPAMACLSLLAALNRTRENTKADISADTYGIFNQNITANEVYLKQQFKKGNTDALRKTSNESLKPLTDSQDPISYALRKYNSSGNQYDNLLSLFFDEAQNPDSNKENFIIKSDLSTYHHAWSHYYNTLAANPQHSNTLFIKKGEVLSTYPSDASQKDVFGIDKHYYVPKIDIKKQEFYR